MRFGSRLVTGLYGRVISAAAAARGTVSKLWAAPGGACDVPVSGARFDETPPPTPAHKLATRDHLKIFLDSTVQNFERRECLRITLHVRVARVDGGLGDLVGSPDLVGSTLLARPTWLARLGWLARATWLVGSPEQAA